jgi:hypothetical protein
MGPPSLEIEQENIFRFKMNSFDAFSRLPELPMNTFDLASRLIE